MTPTLFSPGAGLFGGILIGLSAVVLMATSGRIAGASSIFGGLLRPRLDEGVKWRWVFIVGLLLGTALAALASPDLRAIAFQPSLPLTIVGGLLVGLGTAWGSGCTSGHGICGIARFSTRSIVATVVFMAVAVLTVILMRHFI